MSDDSIVTSASRCASSLLGEASSAIEVKLLLSDFKFRRSKGVAMLGSFGIVGYAALCRVG